MDAVYFIFKYIPFWGVPMIFILVPTGYIFWTKDRKAISAILFGLSGFCIALLAFWVWAGGPTRAVQAFESIINH
ncbi:MAG: hypothetical protein KC493_01995 [Bacteriovoracaceae bacterium]|nr:hypothetical protein [Bacteriovoracaceae bacterium]